MLKLRDGSWMGRGQGRIENSLVPRPGRSRAPDVDLACTTCWTRLGASKSRKPIKEMARALRRIRDAPHFCATRHEPRRVPDCGPPFRELDRSRVDWTGWKASVARRCGPVGYSPHPNPNEGGNSQACHLLSSSDRGMTAPLCGTSDLFVDLPH